LDKLSLSFRGFLSLLIINTIIIIVIIITTINMADDEGFAVVSMANLPCMPCMRTAIKAYDDDDGLLEVNCTRDGGPSTWCV
jgi:hypothetical protein